MTDCTSCERMAKAEGAIESLQKGAENMENKLDKVDGKIDTLKYWIMGVMATALASIFVNLVT